MINKQLTENNKTSSQEGRIKLKERKNRKFSRFARFILLHTTFLGTLRQKKMGRIIKNSLDKFFRPVDYIFIIFICFKNKHNIYSNGIIGKNTVFVGKKSDSFALWGSTFKRYRTNFPPVENSCV